MKDQGSGTRDQGSDRVPPARGPRGQVFVRGVEISPLRPGSQARWLRFTGPAVILLAAAFAVAPQLLRGNSCGHDFDFHLVSWFDCLNSWRHGILYPHWSPSANYGAGEPRFVFYPPLTWMLGAALGLLLPWNLVPIALTWLLLAGTGLATRALARQALSEGAATLAGCAAIFSGYALFCAYERSAFGELSGGFWIPLLLLFILCGRSPSESAPRRIVAIVDGPTLLLALVVAGAWLSNVPLGIMASYLLAGVALAVSILAKSWIPAARAAIAAALGFGLAAIYLVPAVWEQRWVDVRQATGDPGEMIENSWLFGRHANPLLSDHDVELRKVSIIATIMIGLALAGILLSWLRGRRGADGFAGRETKKGEWSPVRFTAGHYWIPLALIPAAVLLLQLPVSLPVWNLLPKLRFLQFPWRWLVVLEAPMAIFIASAVWPRNKAGEAARRWPRIAILSICTACFVAMTVFSGRVFFQVCDDEDAVQPMSAAYRSGAGFTGTDEYAPPGADNTLVPTGLPFACLVTDPSIALATIRAGETTDSGNPAWDPAQRTCGATFAPTPPNAQQLNPEHLNFSADIPHPGFLILRLRNYPAWRVMVNGSLIATRPTRDDGLMALPVPPGTVRLSADWTATPDVLAGRFLSALAALSITGLFLLSLRRARPRL